MSGCPGKRVKGSYCPSALYRCKKCGAVGCDQPRPNECSNQKFVMAKCQSCGASNQKEGFNR